MNQISLRQTYQNQSMKRLLTELYLDSIKICRKLHKNYKKLEHTHSHSSLEFTTRKIHMCEHKKQQ